MKTLILLDPAQSARLVLTLFHCLWQGALLAALALAGAALFGKKSARLRYGIHVAALALMAACPPATFFLLQGSPVAISVSLRTPTAYESKFSENGSPAQASSPSRAILLPESANPAKKSAALVPAFGALAEARWARFCPMLVLLYLGGVLFMLARLFLALRGGRRLCREAQPVADPAILASLARGVQALGLHFTPVLAYCRQVAVPTVIGALKPTILLPLALTSGLTPEQVEMLLLHELAHLRRWDHWILVGQRVIEAMLFFHPAVWVIARRIRSEREHCCDDMVVAAGFRGAHYAASLLRVAELSQFGPIERQALALGLGADGRTSQLGRRILRLVQTPAPQPIRLVRSWPVAAVLILLAGLASPFYLKVQAQGTNGDKAAASQSQPANLAKFKKSLPGGITVELIGVSRNPSKGQPWWSPDGSPRPDAVYDDKPVGTLKPDKDSIGYEFAARLANLAPSRIRYDHQDDAVRIRWDSIPSGSRYGGDLPHLHGRPLADIRSTSIQMPKDLKSCSIRLGLAAGKWKSIEKVEAPFKGIKSCYGSYGNIAFGEAYTDGAETKITVALDILDQQTRVVAIDQSGREHAPIYYGSRGGKFWQALGSFDLPLAQIKEIQFQVRPYEWVEFKNVALAPRL